PIMEGHNQRGLQEFCEGPGGADSGGDEKIPAAEVGSKSLTRDWNSQAVLCDENQFRSQRQISRQPNVPNQADSFKSDYRPPTWIPFIARQSQLRGAWIGVVIVVPALAHGEERRQGNVSTLHGCAAHFAYQGAVV